MPDRIAAFKVRGRLQDKERDENLKSISLHHLIREGGTKSAELIRSMDIQIKLKAPDRDFKSGHFSTANMLAYRKALSEREKAVLSEASVILCTCTTSSARRISSATNIHQVKVVSI
jgi:hypothetical protein